LAVKKAHLVAAERAVEQARERVARLAQLTESGAVSQEGVDRARSDLAAAEAQRLIRQAELAEPEVGLKPARRRLAALQPQGGGERQRQEQRLLGLERRLDALRKEVEALRRELSAPKPR